MQSETAITTRFCLGYPLFHSAGISSEPSLKFWKEKSDEV